MVQEYHRQLFASSSKELRQEIKRITGVEVQEAAAEAQPATGVVVHAFTTGAVVQVFQLAKRLPVAPLLPGDVVLPKHVNHDPGRITGLTPPKGSGDSFPTVHRS